MANIVLPLVNILSEINDNTNVLIEQDGVIQRVNVNKIAEASTNGNVSPSVNITQTDNGAIISITDKDGTTTATIANGETPEVIISEIISMYSRTKETE